MITVTTLMTAHKKSMPNPHSTTTNPELIPPKPPTKFSGRNGLGAYLANPSSRPDREILFFDSSFVAIPDLYPKATVHALLLVRDLEKSMKHPLVALNDEALLAEVKKGAERLKKLVASELRRRFGSVSAQEKVRREAMDTAESGDVELPRGRDWEKEVIVGVHAGPSMTHLHVHVLSRDMHAECLRHRKHYNSFTTPFFVGLDEFPLGEEEVRRKLEGRAGWLQSGFICWRCGENFGARFKQLKEHLEEEYKDWVKE